ncbi:MAG TPA: preprotein translocase subunit SecY [Nanoarchaeota archaeon]|nr:MAG: preprotein translocase subunit SecY [archaeon GW2011_AR6]HIH17831.1 preprotein translocase subunit SecY [Nanoarchaeota archaeon]HIH34087.1 preprotein translocase subunit SecY [Nanoarchaeota archaeon]HIH51796.1 preprotein translocase subunit SecY [Nanoarchaeota archaeon]HIH66291.1 preprotein translocase subunit SecY [Nanoarchaeota archaeon]
MGVWKNILLNLPEVKAPADKKQPFNTKLKWTLAILVAYFILALIPLYGLGEAALQRFEFLAIILGTSFGSVISLGIGPIVTASIVLQLLVGAKILNLNLRDTEGRKMFQGLQKTLGILFTIFEAIVFVMLGGLSPAQGFSPWVLIGQLFVGGILIIFMDEVISKYGFGSGVSLFIVAGVASELFIRLFSPFTVQGGERAGRLWVLFKSLSAGDATGAGIILITIITTIVIFLVVVWAQSIKAEIPLSFGRVRGFGIRWPLNFFYASNIPVILTAALMANVQLLGTLSKVPILEGIATWLNPPAIQSDGGLLGLAFRGSLTGIDLMQSFVYLLFMVGGSILFAVFWVKTSGMDAKAQARNILASGLQIPGFRKDERILESVLNRYIMPLTVMGGIGVGLLAAFADLLGALVRGTGLLLAVMIVYKLYEEIAQQHAMDMHPAMRKFIEK